MKSDYLDPRIYERLYHVMQYDNVLALRVALETGLRINDVLQLRWDDFKRDGKFTYIAQKTGKKGTKTISKELYKRLFARRTGQTYLFPGRKRGRHRTRQAVWKDIKKAAAALGVSGNASPHSTRKTYAVGVRRREGVAAVQRELQHDRMDTTMLYAFSDMLTPKEARTCAATAPDAEQIALRVVELLTPLLEEIKKSLLT